jgi:hypothetical protein
MRVVMACSINSPQARDMIAEFADWARARARARHEVAVGRMSLYHYRCSTWRFKVLHGEELNELVDRLGSRVAEQWAKRDASSQRK